MYSFIITLNFKRFYFLKICWLFWYLYILIIRLKATIERQESLKNYNWDYSIVAYKTFSNTIIS